ncbi:Tigger transposable element-derived protein 4 [Eumeta japonica]|uniref:Tigger transposable element-derived protein 4 n=1 Tax=Eumeta variegata TaxID=151549 RepID=A0A4C1WED8_EUMVA|nr:Tigger transposable element-derived protein 4 [Eumeta japonica]
MEILTGTISDANVCVYMFVFYKLKIGSNFKHSKSTRLHLNDRLKSLDILYNSRDIAVSSEQKWEKISDVGKRFGFSRSTVSTIWKTKKNSQAESEGKSCKKLKKPKYEDLDQAILSWFHQQRQNNMPISGPLVKAKAENFAEELGLAAFKASEGWLGKFKQRHHINYGKISGEARSVDTNMTHDWINKVWSKFKEKYAPSDIFNADEAGIFYKLTPDKTLKFKGEKCVGGKLSKERITVLVAANMDGTEKRKLMVIGKSKNPRCFKNITKLPVTYKANKSAWMTSQLLKKKCESGMQN